MLTNKDLKEVHHILAQEPRLLKIKGAGSLVFVGDTHGDCDASKKVLKNYLVPNTKIVFLGDYVDRGGSSIENINFLLSMKLHYPEQIFLLMGNHEGYGILRFSPTDFWEILSCEEMKIYKCVLSCMPYALTTENGIIALHGVLPDLDSLEKIDEVKPGDENWFKITWGDFIDKKGEYLGESGLGRPTYGKTYFDRVMEALGKQVLVRSHQPNISQTIFEGRCLTIFTSRAYGRKRNIAIVDLAQDIKSAKDIVLKKI